MRPCCRQTCCLLIDEAAVTWTRVLSRGCCRYCFAGHLGAMMCMEDLPQPLLLPTLSVTSLVDPEGASLTSPGADMPLYCWSHLNHCYSRTATMACSCSQCIVSCRILLFTLPGVLPHRVAAALHASLTPLQQHGLPRPNLF